MQAGESEEDSGTVGQSSGPSAVPGLPWWGGIGHQPLHTTSSSPAKTLFLEHPAGVTAAVRPVGLVLPTSMREPQGQILNQPLAEGQSTDLVATKMQSVPQSGYDGGVDEQQQSAASGVLTPAPSEYLLPHTQLELGHSMARAAYPYADPYFGGMVAAYGAQAMIHPHMHGVQQARMPLPSEMVEEEPVYVNAKQYHGILRRRQSRAKAESENKLVKSRKPYLHESRHRHAMKRARGCGGRFLNTKSKEAAKSNADGNRSTEGQSLQIGCTPDSNAGQLKQGVLTYQNQGVQTVSGIQGQAAGGVGHSGVNAAAFHPGMLSHSGHPIMASGSLVHGGFHIHQNQTFHSTFQPHAVGSDEADGGQSGGIMSNGSQQRAVATQ